MITRAVRLATRTEIIMRDINEYGLTRFRVNARRRAATLMLVRTDAAVGLSYTVGESEIVSDFDRCYPWSDMQEVTDEHGNVFIKIPNAYVVICAVSASLAASATSAWSATSA